MKVGKSMQCKIKSERTYIWNLESRSSQSTNTGGFFYKYRLSGSFLLQNCRRLIWLVS